MNIIKNLIEKLIIFGTFVFAMIAPSLAFAEEVPNVEGLFDAITSNNYPLAVAFGLSILVFFIRRTTQLFPKKAVPYIVLTIAIVSGASTGIIMTDGFWYEGLVKGLLEGLSAGLMSLGWWSAALKNVLKFPEEK